MPQILSSMSCTLLVRFTSEVFCLALNVSALFQFVFSLEIQFLLSCLQLFSLIYSIVCVLTDFSKGFSHILLKVLEHTHDWCLSCGSAILHHRAAIVRVPLEAYCLCSCLCFLLVSRHLET